jgi:hypothetical protein
MLPYATPPITAQLDPVRSASATPTAAVRASSSAAQLEETVSFDLAEVRSWRPAGRERPQRGGLPISCLHGWWVGR